MDAQTLSNSSTSPESDGLQYIRNFRLAGYKGLGKAIIGFRQKISDEIVELQKLEDSDDAIDHLFKLNQNLAKLANTFQYWAQRANLLSSEDNPVGPVTDISQVLEGIGRSAADAFEEMDQLLRSKEPQGNLNTAENNVTEGWKPVIERFKIWSPSTEKEEDISNPSETCYNQFINKYIKRPRIMSYIHKLNVFTWTRASSTNSWRDTKLRPPTRADTRLEMSSIDEKKVIIMQNEPLGYFLDLAQFTNNEIRNIIAITDTYVNDILRTQKRQKREKESLGYLTTVSTIISAVTATTLQISLQASTAPGPQTLLKQQLFNAANALWFCSLSLSISAAMNTILDLFRRSYIELSCLSRNAVPEWILSWIHATPRALLGLSVITFEAGLCLLSFALSLPLVTSVVTSVLTVCGSLTLALLFAGAQIPGIRRSQPLSILTEQRLEQTIRFIQQHSAPDPQNTISSYVGGASNSETSATQRGSSLPGMMKDQTTAFKRLCHFPLMRDSKPEEGVAKPLDHLAFSPNGKMIISCNGSNQYFLLKVCSGDNGQMEIIRVPAERFEFKSYYSAAWFADSQHLLLWKKDHDVGSSLWALDVTSMDSGADSTGSRCHKVIDKKVPCVAMKHDSKSTDFFSCQRTRTSEPSGERKDVIYLNNLNHPGNQELIWKADSVEFIQDMSLTPDDKYIICAAIPYSQPPAVAHMIMLDVQEHQPIRVIANVPLLKHVGTIRNCSTGRSGHEEYSTLINNQDDNIPQLWQLKVQSGTTKIRDTNKPSISVDWQLQQAYSPKGEKKTDAASRVILDRGSFTGCHDQYVVASSSESKELFIWNRRSGALCQRPPEFGRDVACFACTGSPFASLIAVGRTDGSIEFWDCKDDNELTGPAGAKE